MRITRTIADLRAALDGKREVIFVPTMGNLHQGHLSLVRTARRRTGVVVASIFVNQLQFAPHEDFATYPRTLERDCELLVDGGCDILFAPGAEEMYPESQDFKVQPPARLADILEGSFRPGFFVGVGTVVLKLFGIVQPSIVVFGKKDYQQLLVIKSMIRQFALPIEVIAAQTVREPSGLAMSSRNGYLSESERLEAVQLSCTLSMAADEVRRGRTDWALIERAAVESLAARGWLPDYVAIRRRSDLSAATAHDALVVLGAARLGKTRLIDNIDI